MFDPSYSTTLSNSSAKEIFKVKEVKINNIFIIFLG